MSNTTFKHQALDNPAESVRLVYVKAQQNAPFLELCLSTHSVANIVPYFAVSYTWGDGILTENISINSHPAKVTKNCLYALKQINRRYPSYECSEEPTYLWIDSICINQDDDEKGHQVAMMGNIYAKATKVLACVGPHANDSLMLRSFLDDIKIHNPIAHATAEILPSGYWCWDMGLGIEELLQSHLQHSIVSRDEFGIQLRKACFDFAERSYWSRVWIIQEFTAADRSGSDLEVLCGYDSFLKSEINLCFYFAETLSGGRKDDRVSDFDLLHTRSTPYPRHCFTMLMQFDASNREPIGDIIARIGDLFHCTKPEDRVYGLLPLVEWPASMPPIQPVYKPSTAMELAELLISTTHKEPLFCKTILEALEIYHDYGPLKALVEARVRIQNPHETGSCSGKYRIRESDITNTTVLPLCKNNTGHLLASLDFNTDTSGSIKDPFTEKAALLAPERRLDKPQALFAGARIAGLICGEAREGDVIVQPDPCSILVLRKSSGYALYKLVGQGLLSCGFKFPKEMPLSRGALERKLLKVEGDSFSARDERELLKTEAEKACEPGEKDLACVVVLRAEPIEWLIFKGQDLKKDSSADEESRYKRLSTKLFMEATIV